MFRIIHDLSSLSEDQKKQYLNDYSIFLGLNPEEGRLDMIWMTSDSVRALVAYCRRGTTDILRDIHGIDVTDLVKEDGPGYVSYKATGISRRGRKEIAVGAYSTTGLTGDRLAAAVATAQTRALRRLTLQFVGGGLLDESEVNREPVQSPASPVAAPAVQPQTKPNTEVGKPVASVPNLKANHDLDVLASLEAANAILAADTASEPTPAKKTRKPRKSKNTVDMGDVPQTGTIVPETGTSASADIPKSQQAATSKLTYVPICPICKDFMAADVERDMFLCIKEGRLDMTIKPSMLKAAEEMGKAAATFATAPSAPAPVAAPVPPPKAISVLTDDEQKQVKARLAPFWVDILPIKGGMTADDGLTPWNKLIKFANSFYPDANDYKKWTLDKWEPFLEFLDEFNEKNGAVALVAHINGKINAA